MVAVKTEHDTTRAARPATPRVAPRRTQSERRASTRAAVLAAAADAIVAAGPSVGVAEIAQRAGVSTGALQHHFRSKADLLVAVVEVGWNDLVERAPQVGRELPLPDRVTAWVDAMWESYQLPTSRAAHTVSSDPGIEPDVQRRVEHELAESRVRLDRAWERTFDDLDPAHPGLGAARRFARSHLAGMVVQRQMTSVEPDPADELALLCDATSRILAEVPAR